jgi:hypothetical protein
MIQRLVKIRWRFVTKVDVRQFGFQPRGFHDICKADPLAYLCMSESEND